MMRPTLLKHCFYYRVESALHTTQLPLGATFDIINYQDHQWRKSRWERTEMIHHKRIIENGIEKTIKEMGPGFYVKNKRVLEADEIIEIENQLQYMDDAITFVIENISEDMCDNAMIYQAAYRQVEMYRFNTEIEKFKNWVIQMIGTNFNQDAIRKIISIIRTEIWETYETKQDQYLELMVE